MTISSKTSDSAENEDVLAPRRDFSLWNVSWALFFTPLGQIIILNRVVAKMARGFFSFQLSRKRETMREMGDENVKQCWYKILMDDEWKKSRKTRIIIRQFHVVCSIKSWENEHNEVFMSVRKIVIFLIYELLEEDWREVKSWSQLIVLYYNVLGNQEIKLMTRS